MAGSPDNKTTVGWREYVALPDWGIPRLRAKIDTGARTSAIHVAQIEELDNGHIRFEVVIRERPKHETVWVDAVPVVRESTVKPSSGHRQQRPVVHTKMVIGGVEREIEISLVCRKGMLCRMLVGRSALDGVFVVDPSRRYLASRPKKTRSEKKGGRI